MGNGSLKAICSLSKPSLSPSLTVLQKLTKSYKKEVRHLFEYCISIPRKYPRKTPLRYIVGGGRTCPPVLPVPPALDVCSVCAALLLINIEDDQQQHRHLVCRRRKTMRLLAFWSRILISSVIYVGWFSDTLLQAFCQSLYFSQTCNLQAEFVYILSAQSRQTKSACRLQVWLKYKDGQNACLIVQKVGC